MYNQCMESLFRHMDVVFSTDCLITMDIQAITGTTTTAFGSNFDGAFDAIATFYCQKTDKPQTPSNVISHDVVFSTT